MATEPSSTKTDVGSRLFNDDPVISISRIEKFNQLVRSFVVLMFSAAFTYAFVFQKDVVSVTEFVMALMVAMNWWFQRPKDDEGEKKKKETETTESTK